MTVDGTIKLFEKLGPGAIIGAGITAVFTLLTAWLGRRHEIRRERFKRKQEILEKIAIDFENVHALFMELFSAFGTYLEFDAVQPGSAEFSRDRAAKIVKEQVFPAFNTLHSIEGRLMLLGYDQASKMFSDYRGAATDLQGRASTDPSTRVPLKEWNDLFLKTHEIRRSIYSVTQKLYKKA